MQELIEKYGKDAIKDALDLLNIVGEDDGVWREFAYMHKVVKRTTKTIRSSIRTGKGLYEYKFLPHGGYERIDYDEPKKYTKLTLTNGRNDIVFQIKYYNEELPKLMEELS